MVSKSPYKTDEKFGLHAMIYRHHGMKLIALVLAVALWYLVVGGKAVEEKFSVPLGIKGVPDNMVVASEDTKRTVEVKVTGARGFVNEISSSDIAATVDLSAAKEGVNIFRLGHENVRVPRGVEVVKVVPSSMDIRVDKVTKFRLPVKVVYTGRPAKGYYIEKISVSPREVLVMGKTDDVKKLGGIKTGAVDISELKSAKKFNVLLDV